MPYPSSVGFQSLNSIFLSASPTLHFPVANHPEKKKLVSMVISSKSFRNNYFSGKSDIKEKKKNMLTELEKKCNRYLLNYTRISYTSNFETYINHIKFWEVI